MSKGSDMTRAAILTAAVQCARTGLHCVTARRVASAAQVHHSNVVYYFKTNSDLLDAVAAQAVLQGDSMVIARLILDRHAVVSDMAGVDRDRHMLRASEG